MGPSVEHHQTHCDSRVPSSPVALPFKEMHSIQIYRRKKHRLRNRNPQTETKADRQTEENRVRYTENETLLRRKMTLTCKLVDNQEITWDCTSQKRLT